MPKPEDEAQEYWKGWLPECPDVVKISGSLNAVKNALRLLDSIDARRTGRR